MTNIVRNVFLVGAMCAVIIMCVGIFLYDYIPTGIEIPVANHYEQSTEIPKILEEAQSIDPVDIYGDDGSDSYSQVSKKNIITQTYEVSKTDLAVYKQRGDYVTGRANPFAEVQNESTVQESETTQEQGAGSTPSSPTTSGNTNSTGSSGSGSSSSSGSSRTEKSDGTFYNSTKTK